MIITLLQLCFGHYVNSLVTGLVPLYFSSEAMLPQENTSAQSNDLQFHTVTSNMMVCSDYCLHIQIPPTGYVGLVTQYRCGYCKSQYR